MKAVDKFEYKRGLQVLDVRDVVDPQAITRAIRDQARTIRIPVHMSRRSQAHLAPPRYLVQEYGPRADAEEIARRWSCRSTKVRKVLSREGADLARDADRREEDSHLGDFNRGTRSVISPAEAVINMNLAEQTRKVLKTLTRAEENGAPDAVGIGE